MKIYKNILSYLLIFAILAITSCGSDDPTPSEQEQIISALTTKTWSANESSTDVSAVNGDFDVTTFGCVFTETATGMSFVYSGDIATYLIGGSFDIDDEGVISNEIVTTADELVVSSIQSITISEYNLVSMSLQTSEAPARIVGVGSYTLSFDGI